MPASDGVGCSAFLNFEQHYLELITNWNITLGTIITRTILIPTIMFETIIFETLILPKLRFPINNRVLNFP